MGVLAVALTLCAFTFVAIEQGAAAATAKKSSSGSFGTLGQVCGPGHATGKTAVGVTDTSIRLATVADVGASISPGLDKPFWDSSTAFVDWCNAAGGILGRKLILDKRDSALTDYPPVVAESCKVDFAMVGGQAVLDDTGLSTRLKCGLPDIAPYIFGPNSVNAPRKAAAFPTPNDQVFLGGVYHFFQTYPGIAKHVGAVFPNGVTGNQQEKIFTEGLKAIGAHLVDVVQYNSTEQTSWAPIVESLKNAGVKLLLVDGDLPPTASLEAAMQTAGWWPEVQIMPPHIYATAFLQMLSIVPKNFYVYTPIVPIEDASKNPPTARYIEIVHKYVPSAQVGFPGIESFSAWLMFAEAAKACGSALTHGCLMSEIEKITAWTGGGLTSTVDPAANLMPTCYVVLQVVGTVGHFKFRRYEPSTGFDCSPKNAPHIAP